MTEAADVSISESMSVTARMMFRLIPSDGRVGDCDRCDEPVYNDTIGWAFPWQTEDGADFVCKSCLPALEAEWAAQRSESIDDADNPFAYL